MKGIVFNLLEEVVTAEHGEDVWDDLVEGSAVSGAYTAVGTYPDEELFSLVTTASAALQTPADDVVRWFGRNAMPLLVERYPVFFEGHDSTRSFVLTLNDVIHPEVRKLFPGAYAPEFDFDTSQEDRLTLGYKSHRNLCFFAEGLLEGAADHFGESVTIEQPQCAKRGGDKCVLVCSFSPKAGASR